MHIAIAITDEDINQCYPVVRELRTHVKQDEFLPRVRGQEADGYRLAMCRDNSEVVAVAGFRIGDNLAWGHYLYVDDLVARAENRSQGHGTVLLSWLYDYAAENGCEQVHLDSGVQRAGAHRFYEREGLQKTSFHFSKGVQEITP
jgi:GNAT superfamily N-acetyltransferase